MIVTARDLVVSYGGERPALDAVNLSVAAGRCTVLLGPSGAGKSTLLRCLNGLVRPQSGSVLDLSGRPILADAQVLKAHRLRTAMVFQHHHLVGRLTAVGNAATGRLGHLGRAYAVLPLPRNVRVAALAALDRLGLLEKADVRADKLSGGEQQRVGIARALVQEPRLILADEPVASLDPANARAVLGLLRQIAREDGIAVLVSLHQVELAREVADRIVGLNAGRVVFDGVPGELTADALAHIYRAGKERVISRPEPATTGEPEDRRSRSGAAQA